MHLWWICSSFCFLIARLPIIHQSQSSSSKTTNEIFNALQLHSDLPYRPNMALPPYVCIYCTRCPKRWIIQLLSSTEELIKASSSFCFNATFPCTLWYSAASHRLISVLQTKWFCCKHQNNGQHQAQALAWSATFVLKWSLAFHFKYSLNFAMLLSCYYLLTIKVS